MKQRSGGSTGLMVRIALRLDAASRFPPLPAFHPRDVRHAPAVSVRLVCAAERAP
jgi:hypothetical protein